MRDKNNIFSLRVLKGSWINFLKIHGINSLHLNSFINAEYQIDQNSASCSLNIACFRGLEAGDQTCDVPRTI